MMVGFNLILLVNIDINCVRLDAYEVGDNIFINPNIIIPLPEAEQFMIYRDKKAKQSTENSENEHLKTAQKITENYMNC